MIKGIIMYLDKFFYERNKFKVEITHDQFKVISLFANYYHVYSKDQYYLVIADKIMILEKKLSFENNN